MGPLAAGAGAAPFPYAGELMAASSALLWACAQIMFARAGPNISAQAMNFGKNVSGLVGFAVFLLITTGVIWPARMSSEGTWFFLAAGFVGLAICDTYLLRCMQAIGPQRMTLILCLAPVGAALAALAPPFSERPGPLAWVGMAVCIVGILIAVRDRPAERITAAAWRRGLRDGLIAAVLQAAAILLSRHAQLQAPGQAVDGATLRMVAGVFGLVAIGLPGMRLLTWGRELARPKVGRTVFVAALIGTFGGILLNQLGLEWTEYTGVASVLNSLMPVYLIPLGYVFLGDRISRRGYLATFVAVGGVVLLVLGGS